MPATEPAILATPGTHWRIATADREALLIDGAAYFAALASAMERARRSITIVGWDIRSTLLLEPEHSCETLAGRLVRLLEATPVLEVRLLIWDWVIAYSLDREFLPQWQMAPLHERLTFVLDDALPVGASHHEKVVVIDGDLAFVGGLDLTDGRWDTPDHDPKNPTQANADTGNRRSPFHDVMMVLDGAAAAAVAELVERRWQRATDQKLALRPTAGAEDVAVAAWPDRVEPQLRDVAIAIARARPDYADTSRAREDQGPLPCSDREGGAVHLYREPVSHRSLDCAGARGAAARATGARVRDHNARQMRGCPRERGHGPGPRRLRRSAGGGDG